MKNIQILLVEGEPIVGADLKDKLLEMGFGVIGPFSQGEKALDALSQATPDLILMDIQLAGIWDGVETTHRILEKYKLPVIYLTNDSGADTFAKAKNTAPAAFMSKPFRTRDLKYTIELAIANSEKENKVAKLNSNHDNTFLLNDRLFIRTKDRMERVFFDDILWVEAEDYYSKIVTKETHIMLTQNLGKLSEVLENRPEFVRVHRSFIVNLKHVEQIRELYLHIGTKQIPLSKSSKEELMSRLKKI